MAIAPVDAQRRLEIYDFRTGDDFGSQRTNCGELNFVLLILLRSILSTPTLLPQISRTFACGRGDVQRRLCTYVMK